VKNTVTGIWDNYVDLRAVRTENLRLKEEIAGLQLRLKVLEEERRENQRLKVLLDLRGREPFTFVAARVVGKDATNWFHSLLIDQGTRHGIQRHSAVITPGGLVGQAVDVSGSITRVQLITDPVSSVGVMLQSSRVTGLLVGTQSERLRIKYLPIRAEVQVGEVVITSGLGGVYPKGIMVGKVVDVDKRSGALFQEATLKPSVDLSRLEEVLVVTGERPLSSQSQRRGE
ncbi:MAG: rod shape-determining protein MreC, partial [Candidatus Methylomirabilales bacterium]